VPDSATFLRGSGDPQWFFPDRRANESGRNFKSGKDTFEGAGSAAKAERARYALLGHCTDIFDDRMRDAVPFDQIDETGEGKAFARALTDRRDLRREEEIGVLVENSDTIRQAGIDREELAISTFRQAT
jgi:hypothetical protein